MCKFIVILTLFIKTYSGLSDPYSYWVTPSYIEMYFYFKLKMEKLCANCIVHLVEIRIDKLLYNFSRSILFRM